MVFESLEAFFEMGGYAAYVWPAYAISLLGMLLPVVQSKRTEKKLRQQLTS